MGNFSNCIKYIVAHLKGVVMGLTREDCGGLEKWKRIHQYLDDHSLVMIILDQELGRQAAVAYPIDHASTMHSWRHLITSVWTAALTSSQSKLE